MIKHSRLPRFFILLFLFGLQAACSESLDFSSQKKSDNEASSSQQAGKTDKVGQADKEGKAGKESSASEEVNQNSPPSLVAQRNENEFLINGKFYHPLDNDLVAVVNLPEGASAENPVPGCAIFHGSGGLFKEDSPGQSCKDDIESSFQLLVDQLKTAGVATVLPSSFYSRDKRFCEDNNNNYIAFGAEPFFEAGAVNKTKDNKYFYRRVATRTIDALATMKFMCDLKEIDCNRTCMIGTSNGGTTIMSYVANGLETHLPGFLGDSQRPQEPNYEFANRTERLANYPKSKVDLSQLATNRPLPKFAHIISPGCSLRKLVPVTKPDDVLNDEDLYYPEDGVLLSLEIGTNDSVPTECYNGGIREIQAKKYELKHGISDADSRYKIYTHQGGEHSLLSGSFSKTITDRIAVLVDKHLKKD